MKNFFAIMTHVGTIKGMIVEIDGLVKDVQFFISKTQDGVLNEEDTNAASAVVVRLVKLVESLRKILAI